MKSCPFCGASLPDEASFCVYCMKELTEKKPLRALAFRRGKRRLQISALILAGALLFGAGVGTGALLRGGKSAETSEVTKEPESKTTQAEAAKTTEDVIPGPLEPDPDDPRTKVYATVQWFRNSAGSWNPTYGYDEFAWEPWDMTMEWTSNTWSCYSCPGAFRSERPRIYFKLDGTEVLVALFDTSANEQIHDDELVQHLSKFIYTRAAQGGAEDQVRLYDFVKGIAPQGGQDESAEPILMNVKEYSLLERLHIEEDEYKDEYTDLNKCRCAYQTAGFPEFGEDNRFFRITRSRYYGGEYSVDIFYYFTFGEDKVP